MTALILRGLRSPRTSIGVWYSTNSRIDKFDFKNPQFEERLMLDSNVTPEEAARLNTEGYKPLQKPTNAVDLFRIMTMPIDFRVEKVRAWWQRKSYEMDINEQQSYVQDHSEVMGKNLALGNLILKIGGSVRFAGKPWLNFEDSKKEPLPQMFVEGWILMGIDVSGVDMYYESFANFARLDKLKDFIACDSPYLDDWCLDVITSEMPNLETLDLTGCRNLTWRGLQIVSRLSKLKLLKIGNIPALDNAESKFICIELETLQPELCIEGLSYLDAL